MLLNTNLVNIWNLLALNDFIKNILALSVSMKALYIFKIIVKTLIKIAIKTIDFILAPIHIIKSGPKDTLGSEFSIVMYGSNILDKVLLHQRVVAIKSPIIVDNIKLIMVSYEVTNIWFSKL